MRNYLSIDLESWAMPNLPEYLRLTSREKKVLDAGNVRDSILETLRILKKSKTKLTFFIVGQIYEWYPSLIDKIAEEGHEIGYHTHSHDALFDKDSLIKTIELSKRFIQRFKPIGFRAPRISIQQQHLKTLKNYGFRYDSSIYGPYSERKSIAGIFELPVTAIAKIPVGSGYFIGMLGKKTAWIYEKINKKNIPVISFLHNWQVLKPTNPSFPTKKFLFSHPYYFPYLVDCASTFTYLLKKFTFLPMRDLL